MKQPGLNRWLWIAGAVSMLAGLALAAQCIRVLQGAAERRAGKFRQLGDLGRLAERLEPYLRARDAFDRLIDAKPTPLADLLKAAVPVAKADDIRDLGGESPQGWVVRRKEVTLADVPFEKILSFMQAAEAQRPPWRLARCEIRSSPETPGTGKMVLVFEALAPNAVQPAGSASGTPFTFRARSSIVVASNKERQA